MEKNELKAVNTKLKLWKKKKRKKGVFVSLILAEIIKLFVL